MKDELFRLTPDSKLLLESVLTDFSYRLKDFNPQRLGDRPQNSYAPYARRHTPEAPPQGRPRDIL